MKRLIEPLIIPQEKLEQLKKIMDSNLSEIQKKNTRRQISGTCSLCNKVPTKITKHRRFGVIVVEKYCDECLAFYLENLS